MGSTGENFEKKKQNLIARISESESKIWDKTV